jgi:hypothetical protein
MHEGLIIPTENVYFFDVSYSVIIYSYLLNVMKIVPEQLFIFAFLLIIVMFIIILGQQFYIQLKIATIQQ